MPKEILCQAFFQFVEGQGLFSGVRIHRFAVPELNTHF